MQSEKRQSFHKRLLALFLISTVAPVMILSSALAWYFQNRIYQQNNTYFSTSLYSISTNLSTYASDLKKLAMTPYIYDDIINFYTAIDNGRYTAAGSDDYSIERFRQNYITAIQRILITAREDITAVSFMPANPDNPILIATSKNYDLKDITDYPYQEEAWYRGILESSEPYDFFTSAAPSYLPSDNSQVISAVHTVRNVFTRRKLGVIRIDASDQIIKDIFKNVRLSPNSGFVIINQNGLPVYQVGSVESSVISRLSQDEDIIETDKDIYDLYKSDVSGMPWQLVFVSSRNDTAKEISIVWCLAGVLSLISILAAYFIFRSHSRKTAFALHSILEVMEQVAQGEFDTAVPDTVLLQKDAFNTEEFSLIAENLNEMIRKLQLYIDRSYKYEISRQEAEYRALQSQVNPHFLYNTLNCFVSMNRLGMKKELEDSILSLTHIFRYTCSSGKLTTVQEEFDFCTQYCRLLKIRYDERLTFHCQVEAEAAGCRIPRLLIQPLVENAIKHGMDTNGLSITIWIRAFIKHEMLVLEECNNGAPIRIDEVYMPGKVGIQNVENRVRIFHPKADFSIDLKDGITSMTIQIPLEGEFQNEYSFSG